MAAAHAAAAAAARPSAAWAASARAMALWAPDGSLLSDVRTAASPRLHGLGDAFRLWARLLRSTGEAGAGCHSARRPTRPSARRAAATLAHVASLRHAGTRCATLWRRSRRPPQPRSGGFRILGAVARAVPPESRQRGRIPLWPRCLEPLRPERPREADLAASARRPRRALTASAALPGAGPAATGARAKPVHAPAVRGGILAVDAAASPPRTPKTAI